MSTTLRLSDTGLRLIKAFEGYRPVDRELVTGARVVGYGHRLVTDQPRSMSREEASEVLARELEAYEELINEEVHAPLTQSQFDALCSLAYNIGPKAFRGSDTLRALNNGRVLDAANGFDIWRKANVNGQTYVVDALMRRRTVEKSLFLRTERALNAPGALLEPVEDPAAAAPTADGLPVFTEDMASGVLARAPYDATPNPMRRREDSPVGILTLSEVIEADDVVADSLSPDDDRVQDTADDEVVAVELDEMVDLDEEIERDAEPKISVISEAADALGDRLERLLDDGDDVADATADWPQSLIKPIGESDDAVAEDLSVEASESGTLLSFPERRRVDTTPAPEPVAIIDEVKADDIIRNSRAPAAPTREEALKLNDSAVVTEAADDEPGHGLWFPIILGFALLGASVVALLRGAEALLGEWGPILALVGAIAGALMVVFALYMIAGGDDDEG